LEFIIKIWNLTFSWRGKKGVFVRVVNHRSDDEDPMHVSRTNKLTKNTVEEIVCMYTG